MDKIILLIISVLFISCSNDSSVTRTATLNKVRGITIDESDDRYIGSFRSIGIKKDPWRLIIPDDKLHQVSTLDSTGKIISVFGEHGRGPGQFERPMHVVPVGDSIYIKESNRYSLFDTNGNFIEHIHLPEGIHTTGRWALSYHDNHFYTTALNYNNIRGRHPSSNNNSIIKLNKDFTKDTTFGSYPDIYDKGVYPLWPDVAISDNGILAVSFASVQNLYLYNLRVSPPKFIREIKGNHPRYKQIEEEMTADTPISKRKKIALKYSSTLSVNSLRDSLFILNFGNLNKGYYDNGGQEYTDHFGIIMNAYGDTSHIVDLPGKVLGSTGDDLYIYESEKPDDRKIGVYNLSGLSF